MRHGGFRHRRLDIFFVNVGPPKSPGRQTFQLNLTFQLTYAQKPDLNERLSTQGENKNWYSTKNMLSKPKRAVSTLSLLLLAPVNCEIRNSNSNVTDETYNSKHLENLSRF